MHLHPALSPRFALALAIPTLNEILVFLDVFERHFDAHARRSRGLWNLVTTTPTTNNNYICTTAYIQCAYSLICAAFFVHVSESLPTTGFEGTLSNSTSTSASHVTYTRPLLLNKPIPLLGPGRGKSLSLESRCFRPPVKS